MLGRQRTLSLAIWLDKIISPIERLCLGVAGTVLVGVTGLIGISVVTRYFMHEPLNWSIQLSEYALLIIVFFVAPWLMKTDGHVSSELVLTLLPKRILAIVDIIRFAISTIVAVLLFWFAFDVTVDNYSRGILIFDVIKVPKYLPLSVMTFGTFLLTLRCLERTFHKLSR